MKATSTSYPQPYAATSSLFFALWLDSAHMSIAALSASIVLLLTTIALAGCMTSGDDAAGVATLELFAGHPGGYGNADGTGAAARFFHPLGLATDSAGYGYVADTGNATIRKISPRADVMTLAGTVNVSGRHHGESTAKTITNQRTVSTDS